MHNTNRFRTPNPNSNRGQHSGSFFSQFAPQYHYGQVVPRYSHQNNPHYGYAGGFQQQRSQQGNQQPQRERPKNQNQQQFNLEKFSIVQEELKSYICPGCSQNFVFTTQRNYRLVGRVPLLLTCRHTVCQECINRGVLAKNVVCPTCKKTSELPENTNLSIDNLQTVFTPNFYLIGLVLWSKPHENNLNNLKQLSLVPTQVTLNKKKLAEQKQPEPEGENCCFLNCVKKATLRCKDCNDVYCTDCCTAVHKSAKSLWSHVQVALTNGKFTAELKKCPEHSTMDVEFFCITCDTGACCYCFIEEHEGHERQHLSKLSTEEQVNFETYRETAKNVLKHLLISQKKLKDLCSGGTTNIEKKIASYFTNLHGQLYFVQKKLLKDLKDFQGLSIDSENNFKAVNSRLEDSIRTCKSVLAASDNTDLKKINLRGLFQKLKDIESTPCYLTCDVKDGNKESAEFRPDPVLENLENLFRIETVMGCELKLLNAKEVPTDFVNEFVDFHLDSDLESCVSSSYASVKEENNRYNKKISSQSGSDSGKPRKRKNKIEKKSVADNEMVEVTHIESLESFYVQLKKQQAAFVQMNRDIDNYVKLGVGEIDSPEINDLCLALYVLKTEKKWCRGRILDIKKQDLETLYEIYFIDYGNTQWVGATKLQQITPQLAQRKPFAIHCELYNPSGATWNKNAHVYMGKVINGKEVYMMVRSINQGVHSVDLMVSSSNRDVTSIIDILIYTYTNVLSNSNDNDNLNSAQQKSLHFSTQSSYVPEYKLFSNSFKFSKGQTKMVNIANVVDPHHIFVQISDNVGMLRSMAAEMKRYYKNKSSDCCVPIEGSYAVVQHKDPIRGNWHRVFVKKVDMLYRKAHVLLVDWGCNITVPWSDIWMLTESFTKLETQAILIKLAHVVPYQGQTKWSAAAIFFLEKNFCSQESLKMTVHNVDPPEVALFEISGDVSICINAQLVQEKMADSTGKISRTVEWLDGSNDQKEFTEEEGFVATLLKKVNDSADADSDEELEEAKCYVKQQIQIVHVTSPSLIYIKFVNLNEQEQELYKELQIHYNKERNTKDSWLENDLCVVKLPEDYARGKIVERVQNQQEYKVYLYDKGVEVVVAGNRLFVYSDYFKKFPNVVYKCYLANIRPAGGDKWSLSSIEALERTFEKFPEMFATKVAGDMKNRCIPVLMWYTQTKVVGALEPTIIKFTSVNNLLVKLGFAYKDKVGSEGEAEKALSEGLENITINNETRSLLNESTDSARTGSDLVVERDSGSTHNTSASLDWNKLIELEEQQPDGFKSDPSGDAKEAEITDWKPALPIKTREFNAWITCADPEGIIYLREEDIHAVYKNMEDNMKEHFDKNPPRREDIAWEAGEICTISYNDYWYRGKIVKVASPTEVNVIMIDFGSDHDLHPEQLYREILYPEIPAFASIVKLDRIYSKTEKWLPSDHDTLLDIVTEYAKVSIKGPLDVDIPLAEVYTNTGKSVNNLLVSLCPNLSRTPPQDSDKSDDDLALVVEEEIDEAYSDDERDTIIRPSFTIEPLPEEAFTESIPMHIVSVIAYNKVVLKLVDTSLDDLEALNMDIQECCDTQPILEDVELGTPCICPYAEDGLWYRARIYNIEGMDCGYVFVFFVDFGNIESVSLKQIKTMKPAWFELPVSCYIAQVSIELKTDNHLEHVQQNMKKLFLKKKLVRFLSRDPLTVELFEKDGELCYQSLIDNGLIRIK